MNLPLGIGVLVIFFASCDGDTSLSVTDYGSLQISMLRHGEKYATNRACYAFEDITPTYHGMTHVRGPNDKVGKISMRVNVPVRIYLAVDSRYPYIHGHDFRNTGDHLILGGCHSRTTFHIYESTKTHGPGMISITFKHSRMTAIFLRDARVIRPDAQLKVTFQHPTPLSEYGMVREGEKFSTNRKCYTMADVPPKYYGMLHLRGINDKTSPIKFTVNVPCVVYVAIDSRYPNSLNTKEFQPTGEKIIHGGCHARTNFPIYQRVVTTPGLVTITLNHTRMLAVFLKPLDHENTFRTGVY